MATSEDGLLSERSPYKATIVPIADPPQRGGGKARQYATAIIVNVAALAAGSTMGWSSPAGLWLSSNGTSPLNAGLDGVGHPVSEEHMSWLSSINFLAGIPGTLLFGLLADRLGRRVAGLVVAVPFALSWVLIATTESLLPLYAARLLAGIASGGTLVIAPLFVGETAQDEHRGALGTFLAVGINSGILFSFVVGAFTTYRVFPLVCLLLPAVYFLGLLRLPETPVYHVKRGRAVAARKALSWYRGGQHVDAELEVLQSAAKREDSDQAAMSDLIRHRGSRRALVQSLVLLANQQFCGVIAVLSNTHVIFQEAGSSLSPSNAAIIVAVMQAVTTYLSSFLMERMGRRTLLIASNLLMAVCLVTLGGCFYAKDIYEYDITAVGWLPVLSMSLYVIAFAVGLGPVPLVLLAETYSTKVRSLATSLGIACQTVSAFATTKFFPNVQGLLGLHACFWLFAAFCAAGAVFTQLCVIETRGKTLEQILVEFHGVPEDDDDVFDKKDAPLAEPETST